VTHHVQIVDAVRAGGHARHDRRGLTRRIRPNRARQPHRLADQFVQVRVLGQTHQRDQARARHQRRIIERGAQRHSRVQ
jgi:hypothetical protein